MNYLDLENRYFCKAVKPVKKKTSQSQEAYNHQRI